jgi:4-amino-4-deoxy-L-arabinose transferase-like glycosyltransferase
MTAKTTPARAPQILASVEGIVLLCLGAAMFVAMFTHALVPSMEPRFAEVVREMANSGTWLLPLKNGLPYVEYPVFYYWLALVLHAVGLPIAAAIRLPSLLAYFAWLAVVGRWSRSLPTDYSPAAFALGAAALPIAVFQFSIAQTDGMLALGVMLAMYGYTRVVLQDGADGWPWVLWGGVALATLAKGPVGLACTAPVFVIDRVVAAVLEARTQPGGTPGRVVAQVWTSLARMRFVSGVLAVVAINVPWYIATGVFEGWDFVKATLVYQNFDRYVTGFSHAQPWWYYGKTFLYDFLPFSFLVPVAGWAMLRRGTDPVVRLAAVWLLYTFLFFTVSSSKQGKYLLPMAPAVVALGFYAIAAVRERYARDLWRGLRYWCAGLLLVFAVLVAAVLPKYSDRIGGVAGYALVREQLQSEPGTLVSFHWPRSLSLYELGAPMAFVRSARELYAKIAAGEIRPGDYVLVEKGLLGAKPGQDPSERLIP